MMLKLFKFLLLILILSSIEAKSIIENAEDGNVSKWEIVSGDEGDVIYLYDNKLNSTVVEFLGGGSYKIGATNGDKAFNITEDKTISWKMKTTVPYTIYVITQTTNGLRYLFYVSSPNRGLLHGFENGIHHGIGEATIDGRWRTVTRNLDRDLKDAEANNSIISVNGFIYSGGNNGRLDNITLYTPLNKNYITDAISIDNNYTIDINNSDFHILQWQIKDFGNAKIIDDRFTIEDINACEFRVKVDTTNGSRELIYTLGEEDLGILNNGKTIHHALGDDRTIGSVWIGDDPINELGLWQGITRDLQEDIRDYEHNNSLISINSFEVKGSGSIKELKLISSVDMNISQNEELEDNTTTNSSSSSNSVGDIKTFLLFQIIYLLLIIFFLSQKSKFLKKNKGLL